MVKRPLSVVNRSNARMSGLSGVPAFRYWKFVSAAVKTVKTWKYQPARYKGQPITVYRIIQIPFKLTA